MLSVVVRVNSGAGISDDRNRQGRRQYCPLVYDEKGNSDSHVDPLPPSPPRLPPASMYCIWNGIINSGDWRLLDAALAAAHTAADSEKIRQTMTKRVAGAGLSEMTSIFKSH